MKYYITFLLLCCVYLTHAQNETEDQLIMSIYFGGGSYYIDEEQQEKLDEFIHKIPDAFSHSVTIHSHTDNIGGAEFNNWLSRMRSDAVIQLLLEKGFGLEALKVRDFGMFNPVYDNSTWEGKIRNRRVDIIFWPQVL